jgi:hypothetical protein
MMSGSGKPVMLAVLLSTACHTFTSVAALGWGRSTQVPERNLGRQDDSVNVVANLALPKAFYDGVAKRHTWCGQASAAAKSQCHLFTEQDRTKLAVLVANCHLEAMGRRPIVWEADLRLQNARDDDVTLVMHVVGQLETVCRDSGTAWSYALVSEQAKRFGSVERKLEEIRATAVLLTSANEETLQSARFVSDLGKQVTEMRMRMTDQLQSLTNASTMIASQMKALEEAGHRAVAAQLASEAHLRNIVANLTQSLGSVPLVAQELLRSTSGFDAIMQRYQLRLESRFPNLLTSLAPIFPLLSASASTFNVSSGPVLALVSIMIWFCIIAGYSRALLLTSVALAAVKIMAENWTNWPASVLLYVTRSILAFIAFPHLALAIAFVIIWSRAPFVLRRAFSAGSSGGEFNTSIVEIMLARQIVAESRSAEAIRERNLALNEVERLQLLYVQADAYKEMANEGTKRLSVAENQANKMRHNLANARRDNQILQARLSAKEQETEQTRLEMRILQRRAQNDQTSERCSMHHTHGKSSGASPSALEHEVQAMGSENLAEFGAETNGEMITALKPTILQQPMKQKRVVALPIGERRDTLDDGDGSKDVVRGIRLRLRSRSMKQANFKE